MLKRGITLTVWLVRERSEMERVAHMFVPRHSWQVSLCVFAEAPDEPLAVRFFETRSRFLQNATQTGSGCGGARNTHAQPLPVSSQRRLKLDCGDSAAGRTRQGLSERIGECSEAGFPADVACRHRIRNQLHVTPFLPRAPKGRAGRLGASRARLRDPIRD